MRQFSLILLTVLTLGFAANTVQGQTASIQQQIAAILHHEDHSKQVNPALFTDDFQGHTLLGDTYNKQQAIHNEQSIRSMAKSEHSLTTILRFTPTKSGAVVVAHNHVIVNILGQRTHKMHVLILDGSWRSVWVKSRKGLQIRRETQLSEAIKKDGKPVVSKPRSPKPH